METRVSLPSIARVTAAYIATRLARRYVVALALLIAIAGVGVAGRADLTALLSTSALALLLVILFRLWDDLADVAHDRAQHPDRVLCNVDDQQPFYWMVAAGLLLAALLLVVWRSVPQLYTYVGLVAAVAALYRLTSYGSGRVARIHLILFKYPIFVYLSSTSPELDRAIFVGAGVYFVLAIYEQLSDPALHAWPARHWALRAEVLGLLVLTGATLWMLY
jgi:hypothetical protein